MFTLINTLSSHLKKTLRVRNIGCPRPMIQNNQELGPTNLRLHYAQTRPKGTRITKTKKDDLKELEQIIPKRTRFNKTKNNTIQQDLKQREITRSKTTRSNKTKNNTIQQNQKTQTNNTKENTNQED